MIADKSGTSYSFLSSQIQYCLYEDYCQNSTDVYNHVQYMEMKYITVNTYYDQQDSSQSIKNYLKVFPSMPFVLGSEVTVEFSIAPSQINFLNGSVSMVYEVKDHMAIYFLRGTNIMLNLLYVYIDPHYIIYQEYYDYQPQLGNTRRQLDATRNVSLRVKYF